MDHSDIIRLKASSIHFGLDTESNSAIPGIKVYSDERHIYIGYIAENATYLLVNLVNSGAGYNVSIKSRDIDQIIIHVKDRYLRKEKVTFPRDIPENPGVYKISIETKDELTVYVGQSIGVKNR